MEVRLSCALCIFYSLLDDRLGLFDELTVQVDSVPVYLSDRIVLAEDELGRLSVVFICFARVLLALF